jgi:2-methylisocitrate lyase-like PEP mutase family enzyme
VTRLFTIGYEKLLPGALVAELEAAGVRRISLATSLFRAAMTGLFEAAREVKERGTFGYLERSLATADLNRHLQ